MGTDGFKIYHKAKIDKAVHDRRASLDEAAEIKPAIRQLVKEEFQREASLPIEYFPTDSTAIPDSPRLTLVVVDPEEEWTDEGSLRDRIAQWTTSRGKTPRLYPAALVWCVRKRGRDLREKVAMWLAWQRVERDVREGILGSDYEKADLREIEVKIKDALEQAKEEVWGSYRFVLLADSAAPGGLRVIDVGAGHSSGADTLCGRVISALTAEGLLNSSVSASYIDRNWPPALKPTGAWPLPGLRQSFLNGALTRLVDPDSVLRGKIVEFVERGEFGLASGPNPDGTYERVWFKELVPSDEVAFEPGVFLLPKEKAAALKKPLQPPPEVEPPKPPPFTPEKDRRDDTPPKPTPTPTTTRIRVSGSIPPEMWNRLGTQILTKLRSGRDLNISVLLEASMDAPWVEGLRDELRRIIGELGLEGMLTVECTHTTQNLGQTVHHGKPIQTIRSIAPPETHRAGL